MKVLLGKDVENLDYQELDVYKKALFHLLVKTNGNRRLVRELQMTLAQLDKTPKTILR